MKEMIFMMGSPAAGKSTIAKKNFSDYKILDSDDIKAEHPDYDPKNPCVLHKWSAEELEKRFQKALTSEGKYVIDGTGANSDKLVRRITAAKIAGFETKVVYVICALNTSLKRNAARERVVLEEIVKEKYQHIDTSFKLVSPHADKVEVYNND